MILASNLVRRQPFAGMVVTLTLAFWLSCCPDSTKAESPNQKVESPGRADAPLVSGGGPSTPNAALQYWMALQFVPTVWGDEWLTVRYDPYYCPLEDVAGLLTNWNRRNIVDPVHRGAQITNCDWQLPATGPETLLWHVDKNREVISFLVVDARHHFVAGEQKQAVEQLCDGVVFLRHLAADGTVGSYPVLIFDEPKLVQLMAHLVPQLKTDALRLLSERLENLASPISLRDRLAKQRTYDIRWLRSMVAEKAAVKDVILNSALLDADNEAMRASVDRALSRVDASNVIGLVESAYDALISVSAMPTDEFDTAYRELMEEIHSDPIKRLFVGRQVDRLVESRNHARIIDLRIELLKAAIVFQLEGEGGFEEYAEKSTFGPLTMCSGEGGYTLICRRADGSQQLALRFGRGALPPPRKKREIVYGFGKGAAKTLSDALRSAKENNKLVLLEFGANWCAPCHALDKALTEDEIVSPLVKEHFVVVKINIGDFSQNRDITTRYGLDLPKLGVPYLMAVDSDGMPIHVDKKSKSPRMPTSKLEELKLALESAIARQAQGAE